MDRVLKTIEEKCLNGEPISEAEGLALFQHPDLLSIGRIANQLREKIHADVTYYNFNLHLNSTNVCEANCLFCSFARLKQGMPEAYSMDIKQAHAWITERYRPGMTEIHIVNGLNPDLPFLTMKICLK
jgi:aminodeoxyfutalosine synthase